MCCRVPGAVLLALLLPASSSAQPAADAPWTPADAVKAARASLEELPSRLHRHVRFLDLGHLPAKERQTLARVLSGHANGTSRETEIRRPIEAAGGRLLRVLLPVYGWSASVWERLKDVDPWYHEDFDRVEFVVVKGKRVQRKKRVREAGRWLDYRAWRQLCGDTRSEVPIVRGDWFLWQTAVQEGRKVGYYDLLGIRDEKGFQQLVRFDAKLGAKLEHRRVVIWSGITQEPRRVERQATVLGGLWRTFDSAEAVGERNPILNLNGKLRFDVTEQLASLPNGMLASYLGDDKGKRADKAPDNIVKGDTTGSGKSHVLHVNLSCIGCHYRDKDESGIKPIDNAPIDKIDDRIKRYDVAKFLELSRQYLRERRFVTEIESDRRGYAAAVLEATGWATHEYGLAYRRAYDTYDGARFDLALAARHLGVDSGRLRAALRRQVLHPVVSVIANGGALPLRQYLEVVPTLYSYLRGR